MTASVTIDLITYDGANDEFVLYLVEDGPWPTEQAARKVLLKAIQDRVLSAADAAIDGAVSGEYPDAMNKAVRIQIDSPSGSPEDLDRLVSAIREFISTDPTYVGAIAGSPHIRGLRVVTGKELGRFRPGE